MDSITRLAKLFRERDNEEHMGIQIGTVQSISPLTVKLGSKIILTTQHLYVSDYLLEHKREIDATGDIEINSGTPNSFISSGEVTIKTNLKSGDQVALMPTIDEQRFILLDKVVKL